MEEMKQKRLDFLNQVEKEISDLTESDFVWKTVYPNNILSNGNYCKDEYCLVYHKEEREDGLILLAKYTIGAQYKLDEEGMSLVEEPPEFYVLSEFLIDHVVGPLEFLPPILDVFDEGYEKQYEGMTIEERYDARMQKTKERREQNESVTLSDNIMNAKGDFVRVFFSAEEAKKAAVLLHKSMVALEYRTFYEL